MNNYFRKPWLIVILIFSLLFFTYEIVKFVNLSVTPVAKITNNEPIIERGYIVDRTGKHLAVQTNFYHVGVSVSQIKNPSDFAKNMAKYLDMSKEEIILIIDDKLEDSYIESDLNVENEEANNIDGIDINER